MFEPRLVRTESIDRDKLPSVRKVRFKPTRNSQLMDLNLYPGIWTRGFELRICRFQLVTRGLEAVTSKVEFVTCEIELVDLNSIRTFKFSSGN